MANERLVTLDDCERKFREKFISESKIKKAFDDKKIRKECFLEYAMYRAWGTAVSGLGKREGDKQTVSIIGEQYDIFDMLKKSLSDSTEIDKCVNDFDEWHRTICCNINKKLLDAVEKNNGAKIKDSYYGIAQKFVNITFKYLYCFFKKGYANYKKNEWHGKYGNDFFKYCHCPVDRIISKNIVHKFKSELAKEERELVKSIYSTGKNAKPWSFMTEKDYEEFQKIVQKICTDQIITSKLFFDFLYW